MGLQDGTTGVRSSITRWELEGVKLLAIGVLAFFVSGCGRGGASEAQSPEDASSSGSSSQQSEEDISPLEPVSAPAEIVLRMRVSDPGKFADALMEATSLPLDWRNLARGGQLGAQLLTVLDPSGAIEAVVVMNLREPSNPHSFFSVGTRGVTKVLTLLDEMKVDVQEAPGGVYLFEVEGEPCAVGRAIAGSPARVVCSKTEESLRRLLPYALRGFPAQELSDADAHLEIDLRPVRERYGKELSRARLYASILARQAHVGQEKYDNAVTDAVSGVAEELGGILQDTDLFTAKVYEEKGAFRVRLSTVFSGRSSTSVQSLLELEKKQGAVPLLFDALPATASAAGYSRQLSAQFVEPWMNVLADLVSGRAEFEGAGAEFSKRISRIVHALGPQGGSSVLARGPLEKRVDEGRTSLDSSWVLLGSEQKKAEVLALLDDIAWVLASKDLKKLFPKVDSFPKFRRVQKALSGISGATLFEWEFSTEEALESIDSDLKLPDGLAGFSAQIAAAAQRGRLGVHEVGGFTWVSWGSADSEVAESFRILSDPKSSKLGESGSLRGVRSEEAIAAGFAKLDGLASFLAWLVPETVAEKWIGLLRATPHRGEVPLTYIYSVEDEKQLEARWELRIPAELTQDAATLGVMLATELSLD